MFDDGIDRMDFNFFADIKDQVMQICEDKGIVDRIFVEKQSTNGSVWIRFRGQPEEAIDSAKAIVEMLNDRQFDDRPIQAKFVPDSLFYAKVK